MTKSALFVPDGGHGSSAEKRAGAEVTVVLGACNGSAYLREQLESIALQTLRPARLILSDDGSTDDTRAIAEEFARDSSFPVEIWSHDRIGITRNFLEPALSVTTPWMAWSDQDDVWHPEKLARCVSALKEGGGVLAFHGADLAGEDLRPLGRRLPQPRASRLLRFAGTRSGVFHGFATVFSTSLLQGIDLDQLPASMSHEGPWYHDELVHELARLSGTRIILHDSLASYRRHGSNVSDDVSALTVIKRARQTHSRIAQVDYAAGVMLWASRTDRFAQDESVMRYLDRVVKDAKVRARVDSAQTTKARVQAIRVGLTSGAYRAKNLGGHGPAALVRDLLPQLR